LRGQPPGTAFGGRRERRRWTKRHLYSRDPRLTARFLFRFLSMYFLKLGFFDGVSGLRLCPVSSASELPIEHKLVEVRLASPSRAGSG
jgi:hypothetical protein